MARRWLIPAILSGLALLGAVGFVAWGKQIKESVEPEIFEVLAQLVLIAMLGAVVSLVVDELNRVRERRQQAREHSRSTFADIVKSYNKIKSLRRRLRAEAVRPSSKDPQAVVYAKEYAALLQCVNDAQLTLEAYVRLIDGNRDLYAASHIPIEDLRGAEKYIGRLVAEWEENLGRFQGDPPRKPIAELPALRCFVGDAGMGFSPGFADPIARVLVALSRGIAK